MPTKLFEEGNAGRPKGSKGKFPKSVKEAFEIAFNNLQVDKKAKLSQWAKDNPTEFYKIASKLIPMDINATIKKDPNISLDFGKPGGS